MAKLMRTVSSKLRGYWNYYGVRGNMKSLSQVYHECKKLLFKWLNRRSQRRSYTWEGFTDMLKHYRIPRPCITEAAHDPQLKMF